jgi:hypothetical protein
METYNLSKPAGEWLAKIRAGQMSYEELYYFPQGITMSDYLVLCQAMRERFPEKVPTDEERLRSKVDVEFVM